jgi:hypothetical protein
MNITYCDLCASPIKDGQSWILYVASPEDLDRSLETKDDVHKYVNKVTSEQKEICCNCKKLFDRIFFHRLEGMAALTEECYDLFNLPPYEKKAVVLTPKTEIKKKKGKK